MNSANVLTMARGLASLAVFTLLWLSRPPQVHVGLMNAAVVVFIAASVTDYLDGVLARRLKQETTFGRIADPFVDKLLVCGTFIFLMPFPQAHVSPWVVAVIVLREFLVSGLRSYVESRGLAFGAMRWGKIKALSQYVALSWLIFFAAHRPWADAGETFTVVLVWCVAGYTALSGVAYLVRAARMLGGSSVA